MTTPQSFAFARWMRTINLLLQGLLFTTFFGGLNYLALHHVWRFDLTQHQRHTLSAETRAYLDALDQSVELVITIEKNSDNPDLAKQRSDIIGLLREYVASTAGKESGRITLNELDVYRNLREAERLGINRANTVIALCNDRRQIIPLAQFYETTDRVATAFVGEQVVTSAVLSVSNPSRPHIYFLAGNGEMQPGDVVADRGLSFLADELRLRNYEISPIDLMQTREVPEDADLIIIAAPESAYSAFEVEMLRRYLSTRAGRVILFLPPAIRHGLDDLLYDWGLVADDVVVLDTDPASVTERGELRIAAFDPDHPMTSSLINHNLPILLGASRVVRPDPGRPLDDSLRTVVLAATSKTAWGERHYMTRDPQLYPVYNPGVDLKGLAGFEPRERLAVVATSERVTPPRNIPFSVRGGRIVVFGNADLISNRQITQRGNLPIVLNAVDWSVDREVRLNTRPRPIERFQLSLSQTDLLRLRYSLLFILPGIAALFGVVVYWTRRS